MVINTPDAILFQNANTYITLGGMIITALLQRLIILDVSDNLEEKEEKII